MAGRDTYFLVLLSSLVGFVFSADICSTRDGLKTCDYGCCDDKCCEYSTMAIVGAVIGGLLLLVSIVCCAVCIYCMCKKKKSRQSSTVQPYQNTNTVYVHNNPYGTSYGGNMPPRSNPPAYNQASSYPSYSNQNDPAYPPGTVSQPPPYTYSNMNTK